jgi:acid phosphatase (class A)
MTAGKPARTLHWLDPQAFAPDHILPEPAPAGSPDQQAEMATLRAFAQNTAPARRAAAAADAEDETLRAFNAAAGRDLTALPATSHLIDLFEQDIEAVADTAKRQFHRTRPYIVDPSLIRCGKESPKGAERSYPSGHATFGWSVAWVLADLMPDRRAALFARARDYGFSREICAAHYPSDIEAGHVLGVLAARALLADPRLAPQIAAARAELAAH